MTRARIELRRIALMLVTGLVLATAAASCSSPIPSAGTNTNWVSCSQDADCAKVGPSAVCSAGVCQAKASVDSGSSTCHWPASANTSVDAGDGGLFGRCTPLPACVGTECRSSPCDSSHYVLWCQGGGPNVAPDPSLSCVADPIPTPNGVTIFCCPCVGEATTKLPACAWPSTLDGDASSRATCHAGRTLLSCAGASLTEVCVSDNPTECPSGDPNRVPGPCRNLCRSDEYVASCGGVGPGPIPDPPAGCRVAEGGPGGGITYCCPCGS